MGSIDSLQDLCSKTITELIESIVSLQNQCSKTITELLESIVLYRTRIPNYNRVTESILSTGPVFQNYSRAIGLIDSRQDQSSKNVTKRIESIVLYKTRIQNYSRVIESILSTGPVFQNIAEL